MCSNLLILKLSQLIDEPKVYTLATVGSLLSIVPVLRVSWYLFDFAIDVVRLTGVNIKLYEVVSQVKANLNATCTAHAIQI